MIRLIRFIRGYRADKHQRVLQFSVFFFLWAIAFSVFEYFAPLYLESLELDFFTIGLILSGCSFISFFIDPILGSLQRRFPAKVLLIASIIMFFVSIFVFIKSQSIVALLFLATNIYGIAFDLFSITSYKKVFDNSVEKDMSTNISFLESLYSLGLLIGALVAGWVVSSSLKNAPYLVLAVLAALFIVIISTRINGETTLQKMPIAESYRQIFAEFRGMGGGGIFLVFMLIFIHLFDGFFFVFEPIFAQKFHGYFLNELIIGGILLAIYTLPSIILEPAFGRLEDRLGRKRFVIMGLAISAASIYILQSFDHLIISAIAIFFASLGLFAVALPAVEGMYESLTERKFGKKSAGYSVSIMEITLSTGFLLGPLLGGIFLSMPEGFDFAFRIFSFATVFMIVMAMIFLKSDNKAKQ